MEGAKSEGGVGGAVRRLGEGGGFRRPVVSVRSFTRVGSGRRMGLKLT